MAKNEEIKRIHKYIEECKKIRENLVHLPQECQPKHEKEYTYNHITIQGFDPGFPTPNSGTSEELRNEAKFGEFKCSSSVTLFYSKARKFYGSTYIGIAKDYQVDRSFVENIYFGSKYHDEGCYAVVELICTEAGSICHNEFSKAKQYGCGWSLLPLTHVGDNLVVPVYKGTPIKLLLSKNPTSSGSFEKSCYNLHYSLSKNERGVKQMLSDRCEENEIVGEASCIPGIVKESLSALNKECLDGLIYDEKLLNFHFKDLRISFSSREDFERELIRFVRNASRSSNDIVDNDKRTTFLTLTKRNREDERATQIIRRKIKILVHNTHAIIAKYERELCVDKNGLCLSQFNKIDFDIKSNNKSAIILHLLYVVRLKEPQRSHLKGKHTKEITVSGGYFAVFPNEISMATEGESVKVCLLADSTCKVFSEDSILFTPLAQKPSQFLEFKLHCIDSSATFSEDDLSENIIPNSPSCSSETSFSSFEKVGSGSISTMPAPNKTSWNEEKEEQSCKSELKLSLLGHSCSSPSKDLLSSEEKYSIEKDDNPKISGSDLSVAKATKDNGEPSVNKVESDKNLPPNRGIHHSTDNNFEANLSNRKSEQDDGSVAYHELTAIPSPKDHNPTSQSVHARRLLDTNEELRSIVESFHRSNVQQMISLLRNSTLPSWSKDDTLKEKYLNQLALHNGNNAEVSKALITRWFKEETKKETLRTHIKSLLKEGS